MKQIYLYKKDSIHASKGDWTCPECKEQNNTEKPGKIVQCTSCSKQSKVKQS